jgi:hypothetical protein
VNYPKQVINQEHDRTVRCEAAHAVQNRSTDRLHRKKDKSSVAAKEEPIAVPEPRTPVDTQDCIAQAQAFYRAGATAKRATQSIPQEFERVISTLDKFCGEEEFDKARISLDWMHTCLQNFSKDSTAVYCSRTASYFCAIDAQSDACIISEAPTSR